MRALATYLDKLNLIYFVFFAILGVAIQPQSCNAFALDETIRENERINDIKNSEIPFRASSSLDFFNKFFGYYLPNPIYVLQISPQCRRDVTRMFTAFANFATNGSLQDRWSLKMVDSWGKSVDGLMQGNLQILGFFDECLSVDSIEDDPQTIKGQYCLVRYDLLDNESQMQKSAPGLAATLHWPTLFSHYGTCMPASCTQDDLAVSLNKTLSTSNLKVKSIDCQVRDSKDELDGSQIFGIIFFSFVALFILCASVMDAMTNTPQNEHLRTRLTWLIAFSAPTNLRKLFDTGTEKSRSEMFTAVHGIRVFSLCWVLWCHMYIFTFSVSSNMYGLRLLTQHFFEQILVNGYKCVDTFFALGGFFLAHNVWKNLDKNPRFPAIMFYVHRIIRLTPPIAVMCCFFATLSSFFVRKGPLTRQYSGYIEDCRELWWVDVTFSNNFWTRWGHNNPEKGLQGCCPQCWYTAVDMQIYIFMPIVILPVYYYRRKGLAWLSFWTFLSVFIPGIIIGLYDLWPTLLMLFNDTDGYYAYYNKIYIMPWSRAGAYMSGVWAAYILRKIGNKPKLSPIVVVLGWTIAFVLSFTLVFCLYPYDQVKIPMPEAPGPAISVIYGSLSGFVWGAIVCWVVLACYWGYGGYINSILSHPVLFPLSRLTFCIFLMHLQIIVIYCASTVRPTYFTHVHKIIEALGMLFFSTIGALILNLIAESPIVRLEKIIFKKK